MSNMLPGVVRNTERSRFELTVGEATALLEYVRVGRAYILTHTEVPECLEGQGVGGALIEGALAQIRAEGATITPLCPFVRGYLERHPAYRQLVQPR